jgi:aconitase B
VEQAFELTDAIAERSCSGSTIKLSEATVAEYLRSNVALMKNMISCYTFKSHIVGCVRFGDFPC